MHKTLDSSLKAEGLGAEKGSAAANRSPLLDSDAKNDVI